jgi:hypothetical protein
MSKEENWNELEIEKPPEEEKIEYEVEGEEVADTSPSNIESVKEEPKEEQPKELEGVDTKGAQKRIRQLIKQRKDREDEIAKLIQTNEALNTKLKNTESEFSNISKLNLDASEKQLTDKLELARNVYKTAHDEGDAQKILQAQESLNEAQNDLKSLSATKQQFQKPEVEQQAVPQQQPYQPQPTPDPRAQEWASQNDWFGQDRIMTAAALAIDGELKEEGFNPTEPEYYSEIDSRLKETFPHKFTAKEEVRQQESSPAQVVSGVSRSSPGSSKKGKVKLTKEDIRLANKWNVSLEQYAQEKLKAEQSDGEYTTINTQRGG